MPRVKIGPAQPDRKTMDVEIARLRDLDVGALRARWHTAFGRRASTHLPRHLLFRVLAYRLQADRFGDLDTESRRLLDGAGSPEDAGKRAVDPNRLTTDLRPGTMLAREWNGQMQRVAVLADRRLPHGMGVARPCDLPVEWSRQRQMLGLIAQ